VSPFGDPAVRRLVALALEEDLGRGDATTDATVDATLPAEGLVVCREPLVFAGGPLVATVLDEAGIEARIDLRCAEGAAAGRGAVVCALRGSAADLLRIERVTLNFLQRLCGVATLTRRFVEAIAGTQARIVDTRKTVPGWRLLDKYAVRMGGGANHRFGLDDGVLVKDNHIVACGGLGPALARARARAHHLLRVEVECETLAQVTEALAGGADAILLDNMKPAELRDAVRAIGGRAIVEASGGVTLATVRDVAETGVDLVSVGALTHSAVAVDLSMDLSLAR
jgi:nicotinate-nucleotide pyrophosphorylase (carboxylating)